MTNPGGTGGITVPANSILPLLIDNGTLGPKSPAATYVGANVLAVDTQAATNSTTDASTPPAKPNPPEPGTGDLGSHSVAITGITATQALITSNQSYNLTYAFGGQVVDYSTLVAHFSLVSGSAPSSISAEYVGGSGQTGFDVRTACTGTLTAAFSKFTCPIPAYAVFPIANTTGPNAVNGGALGYFTPQATKIYFVLNYSSVPAAPATSLGIDNVYAIQ